MKIFNVRRQTVATNRIGATTPCQWLEAENDDIKITIDGSKTDYTLIIRIEANGVIYRMTDALLELALGQVAEQFSNDHLNFHVYQVDRHGNIT